MFFSAGIDVVEAQPAGFRQITGKNVNIVFSSKTITCHSRNFDVITAQKNKALTFGHAISFRSQPSFSDRKKINALENKFNSSVNHPFCKRTNSSTSYNNKNSEGIFSTQKSLGSNEVSYSERVPFEETDQSLLKKPVNNGSVIMRASNEDDPGFPGDPGQMPVGDGVWFLLGASFLFILLKTFLIKKNI